MTSNPDVGGVPILPASEQLPTLAFSLVLSRDLGELDPVIHEPHIVSTLLKFEALAGSEPIDRPRSLQIGVSSDRAARLLIERVKDGRTTADRFLSGDFPEPGRVAVDQWVSFEAFPVDRTTIELVLESDLIDDLRPGSTPETRTTILLSNEGNALHEYSVVNITHESLEVDWKIAARNAKPLQWLPSVGMSLVGNGEDCQ
jgi:hypothetical protein